MHPNLKGLVLTGSQLEAIYSIANGGESAAQLWDWFKQLTMDVYIDNDDRGSHNNILRDHNGTDHFLDVIITNPIFPDFIHLSYTNRSPSFHALAWRTRIPTGSKLIRGAGLMDE